MTQLQKLLSKREYLVISSLLQGMKPDKIAEEFNISRNAVDQARYRAKQKLGEEFFSKIFAPVSEPRDKCVQNSRDLEEVLTPTELRVFLSIKRSDKNWEMVAEEAQTTPECARKLVPRIKKKLGEKYDELVKTSTPIEGVTIMQKPGKENDPPCCQNCRFFYSSIIGEKGEIVFCSKHLSRLVDSTLEICASYEEYIRINKNLDRELLDEALKDKNYLRMAFKIGTGYEPKSSIERTQYAIAGLGFKGYLFRRRRQARALLEGSARYMTVRLENKDRNKKEVQEILKRYKLFPTKSDFDEEGTTSYYVIKDYRAYVALMAVLSGDIDFIIAEEGTLTIMSENNIRIQHISIADKSGNRYNISLDNPGMFCKEHTAEFPFGPGQYVITISIGTNLVYKYEITVDKKLGQSQITKCKLL